MKNARLPLWCLILIVTVNVTMNTAHGFEHFITADGHRLMDGDKPFRFISFNVPTVNYQEDEMAFTVTNPYALPTEYELRDIFETVRQMGGRAIRNYTIPVRNAKFPGEAPTYVEAPGEFNEEAFRVTDMMLALANEYGIRVVFSLLNNWEWMGGRPDYAAFRGKDPEAFWTDRELIEDFKKMIEYTLNRRNTVTGVRYKDDKAVLCWETGNELQSPMEWTREIARYIKSLDENHLVADGYYAIDSRTVREASIEEPSIDIVSSHHYEQNPFEIPVHIQDNLDVVRGRKPYLVGEFGFAPTAALEEVLEKVVGDERISGALLWSLRHHRRHGGFYWHSEPLGGDLYKAYHWPGFASGGKYDETNLLAMYREKAFEIRGVKAPPLSPPAPPQLLPVEHVYAIGWRGSAGASGYNVERAESKDGPWTRVGYNVSDAAVPYFPLFNDEDAESGRTYYYRVVALNRAGASEPSNVAGPVKADRLALVDDMENLGRLYHGENVTPVAGQDRSFKEDIHRLKGGKGARVVYRVPGDFRAFRVYAFEEKPAHALGVSVSRDGRKWKKLAVTPEEYVNAESNYDYWRPKLYSYDESDDIKYIRLDFSGTAQLGRVEVEYTGSKAP